MGRKKLGEALLDRKRISPSDLKQALEEQQRRYMLLGELLLERRLVSKEALVSALEEVSRFHYVDSRFATVETALLELIPRTTASFYCALPLAREGRNTVVMVMAEPQNLRIIDELRFLTGMAISPRLGFRAEINEAIEHCYSRADPERAEATKLPFIEQVDTSDMQFYAASASQGIEQLWTNLKLNCATRKRQPCGLYRHCWRRRQRKKPAIYTSSREPWVRWRGCAWTACCANSRIYRPS
jgi:hypothetical protein